MNDVFNGIMVTGNMVDNVMFYGRGAGKLPTASAVVSDVIECVKNQGRNVHTGFADIQPVQSVNAPSKPEGKKFRVLDA